MAMTHTAASARFNFRSMTDTLASKADALASESVPFAMTAGSLAVDATAFAMDAAALSMDGLSILCMRSCLAGSMRVAHDPAEVEPVVVRDFAPAFPSLVHCHDVVEALARLVGQQVRSLQFAVAKPCRRPLSLQRIDGNAGLIGNPRQIRCARNSDAECQRKCRCD